MKTKKIIAKDSDKVKNVLLQVNLESGRVIIHSSFSSWDNLAYLLEGVGLMAKACLQEGMSKEEVPNEINDYLEKVLQDYQIKDKLN